jgi:hypothetical protein
MEATIFLVHTEYLIYWYIIIIILIIIISPTLCNTSSRYIIAD